MEKTVSPTRHPVLLALVIGLVLVTAAVLALTSLTGDSITFDETSHLTSGLSYLVTGDFRLAPDHPPLAKMWAALPLLLTDHRWSRDVPGWREGVVWQVGRYWLTSLDNHDRLLTLARCMMVGLLLATCLTVYVTARAVFGTTAGFIAMYLTALCPTMLAHGRLVTTDLPATICFLLTILMFARLAERISVTRFMAAGLSLGALSLTKFSWPLVVPTLLVMAALAIGRAQPIPLSWRRTPLSHRAHRALALALLGLGASGVTWLSIWTCYGWRYSPYAVGEFEEPTAGETTPGIDAGTDPVAWDEALLDDAGHRLRGLTPAFVRWARDHRLLPEAYLYGLAYTAKTTRERDAYFLGEISRTGWWTYFPIAFAIKTPLAVILLLLGGIASIANGRMAPTPAPILFIGLVVFATVYSIFAITGGINIGHRHLLPVYPIVHILAGAAAGWLVTRAGESPGVYGRWLVGMAMIWVLGASLWIHPHYLSYFNELIGGPKNGHHYLADSNIDWGQDLKRLANYAARHPTERIKLAYFGTADPGMYGIDCDELPSSMPSGPPAELTGGTYVISVTQLLGVNLPEARDAFWDQPVNRRAYAELTSRVSRAPLSTLSAEDQQAEDVHRYLSACLLLNRLQRRIPDERIGYSLFVFRLTDIDLRELIVP